MLRPRSLPPKRLCQHHSWLKPPSDRAARVRAARFSSPPRPCGSMSSTRIASPCFTRIRFQLRLSSRDPQYSAKRARHDPSDRGGYELLPELLSISPSAVSVTVKFSTLLPSANGSSLCSCSRRRSIPISCFPAPCQPLISD